jgi:phosphoglycerate dehydrogenase-like enzyme
MAKVLIIDPLGDYYREGLQRAFPSLAVSNVAAGSEVGDLMADADVLCAMGGARVFDDELVRRASKLKWIQAFTTGTDGITRQPSLKREVLLTSMRGIHGPQMSEMALLMMIALARDYPRMFRNQEKRAWERFRQRRLYDKTLAILGVGIIGTDLAKRAKAFGMTVIGITGTPRAVPGFDRMVGRAGLEEAAGEADFLAVLVPYSADTDKIVNARVLAAMKREAYLVNIARGGVCDEEALLAALREKRIAGAALDVFASEPLDPAHPFWKMDNVIVSPHLGGQSDVYHEQVLEVLVSNMRCFLENRSADMVNRVPH